MTAAAEKEPPALAARAPILAGKLARMHPQQYLDIFGITRKDSGT